MASGRAIVHPNVALAKYWGKAFDGVGNFPAVSSLSVSIGAFRTTTHVTLRDDLAGDVFVLNGRERGGRELERVSTLLDVLRTLRGDRRKAMVVSDNDFPTASGLASSASGFAGLALAANAAFDLGLSRETLSDLARRASVSAARSVYGGYVELLHPPTAAPPAELAASPVAPPDRLPARILVCVTTTAEKSVSSTDGMLRTQRESPWFSTWQAHAGVTFEQVRSALVAGDLVATFGAAESSAFCMHASALACGLLYWSEATTRLVARVRALRETGARAWCSIDAGPHVKVLVHEDDATGVRDALALDAEQIVESGIGGEPVVT